MMHHCFIQKQWNEDDNQRILYKTKKVKDGNYLTFHEIIIDPEGRVVKSEMINACEKCGYNSDEWKYMSAFAYGKIFSSFIVVLTGGNELEISKIKS